MSFFTMTFIVSILGAIIGVIKPWMGGIPGLLIAPFLFYFSTSIDIIPLIISMLLLFLFGLAYGCMASIIFSGLKGRGHSVGQTFRSGFGAHHPGGMILSDEDIKTMSDKDVSREIIFSY